MKNLMLSALLMLSLPVLSFAQIEVMEAWARASVGGANAGAAYITLLNTGQTDQILTSASSDEYAEKVELHKTEADDRGVLKMIKRDSIKLPPNVEIGMAPGGTHIMLMGLKQPLVAGYEMPIKLEFLRAPSQYVKVVIKPIDYARPSELDHTDKIGDLHRHGHHHH